MLRLAVSLTLVACHLAAGATVVQSVSSSVAGGGIGVRSGFGSRGSVRGSVGGYGAPVRKTGYNNGGRRRVAAVQPVYNNPVNNYNNPGLGYNAFNVRQPVIRPNNGYNNGFNNGFNNGYNNGFNNGGLGGLDLSGLLGGLGGLGGFNPAGTATGNAQGNVVRGQTNGGYGSGTSITSVSSSAGGSASRGGASYNNAQASDVQLSGLLGGGGVSNTNANSNQYTR